MTQLCLYGVRLLSQSGHRCHKRAKMTDIKWKLVYWWFMYREKRFSGWGEESWPGSEQHMEPSRLGRKQGVWLCRSSSAAATRSRAAHRARFMSSITAASEPHADPAVISSPHHLFIAFYSAEIGCLSILLSRKIFFRWYKMNNGIKVKQNKKKDMQLIGTCIKLFIHLNLVGHASLKDI